MICIKKQNWDFGLRSPQRHLCIVSEKRSLWLSSSEKALQGNGGAVRFFEHVEGMNMKLKQVKFKACTLTIRKKNHCQRTKQTSFYAIDSFKWLNYSVKNFWNIVSAVHVLQSQTPCRTSWAVEQQMQYVSFANEPILCSKQQKRNNFLTAPAQLCWESSSFCWAHQADQSHAKTG